MIYADKIRPTILDKTKRDCVTVADDTDDVYVLHVSFLITNRQRHLIHWLQNSWGLEPFSTLSGQQILRLIEHCTNK